MWQSVPCPPNERLTGTHHLQPLFQAHRWSEALPEMEHAIDSRPLTVEASAQGIETLLDAPHRRNLREGPHPDDRIPRTCPSGAVVSGW